MKGTDIVFSSDSPLKEYPLDIYLCNNKEEVVLLSKNLLNSDNFFHDFLNINPHNTLKLLIYFQRGKLVCADSMG